MKKEKGSYIVLKIGDLVFSTKMFNLPTHRFDLTRDGEGGNIWVKGEFEEKKGHIPLKKNIPFELNIYSLTEEKEKERK